MSDTAYVERDGTIATVILNRPERLNALDLDMATLLVRHLQGLALDDGVSTIILTGSGRGFCAGGDLGWAAAYPGGPASALYVLASHLHQALLEIDRTGKPVIAAVNGVAAGAGFSLALACDFRVLDGAAMFRQAYTSAGLSIDGGGTFMLPRLARALEVAAFDEPQPASQRPVRPWTVPVPSRVNSRRARWPRSPPPSACCAAPRKPRWRYNSNTSGRASSPAPEPPRAPKVSAPSPASAHPTSQQPGRGSRAVKRQARFTTESTRRGNRRGTPTEPLARLNHYDE